MTNFYEIMINKQKLGKSDVISELVKKIRGLVSKLPPGHYGSVPFNYDPFSTFDEKSHDLEFGLRILEDLEKVRKLEVQVYLPETTSAYMKKMTERQSLQYLQTIEEKLDLKALENLSIMDVGAGSGTLLLAIAELITKNHPNLKLECSLFDNNEVMIGKSKETFGKFSTDHKVNFRLYDVNEPVKDEFITDIVMSHTMLHHLKNPKEAVVNVDVYAKKLLIVRDLSRPPLANYSGVLAEQGKFYEGAMRQLFGDSLIASLSFPEFCCLAKDIGAEFKAIEPMYQVLIKEK